MELMELKEGFYDGVICSFKVIRSRFNKEGVLELWFECGYYNENKEPGGKCDIYLELSNNYGMSNGAQKMWWQIAKDKLDKLGWQGPLDLTKLGQLVNKPCRLSYSTVDKDGRPHKNGPRWNFSFRKDNVEVSGADANAMLAQMMGGVSGGAPSATPNPFM